MIKDGNKAVSEVAYFFSELCAIYPITPSSPMASNAEQMAISNMKNMFDDTALIVQMQSEAGAAGCMHGALTSGLLASTFTSSQGLLLMIPNMYKMAGEMLPGVMHVAARSLSTHALSIFGDHQDVYATRSTGFCMLSSSSVNNAQFMAAIAHLSAIKGSLPFLHFFDGFRTSHEINVVEEINYNKLKKLVDQEAIQNFRNKALNVGKSVSKGLNENEDIYFQATEARNIDYDAICDIVNDYMTKISEEFNQDIKPFNYYGDQEATNVIIAMGSVCDTIRLVVDDYLKKGKHVGMVEVHLYRPFSAKYLKDVLPKSVLNIAVLDRTKEHGSVCEPLCSDVTRVLYDTNIQIVGGRYGISSKNTPPNQIKAVYDMLDFSLKDNFTIGIVDDITNLSLELTDYKINLNATEMLIYGYGSDGMVSASKDILKVIEREKKQFIQGYFEYDSKKSGGVTISHLRIANNLIKAPYYVDSPKLIVIAKDIYVKKLDLLKNLAKKGTVLLNTSLENNLNDFLPNEFKKTLQEKQASLVLIDANKIALNHQLNGKISKIMELVILEFLGVSNALEIVKDDIKLSFKNKGVDVVNNNIAAIKETLNNIYLVDEELQVTKDSKSNKTMSFLDMINAHKGEELKVSDLFNYKDGMIKVDKPYLEKEHIAKTVPVWISQNCLQCGKCSFVCPHGVIRTFVTDDMGIKMNGVPDKKYLVAVNPQKCTECGLCVKACPTSPDKKALVMGKYEENKRIEELFDTYESTEVISRYSVRGSQLLKPRFLYPTACAGCGETAYIKLLTQLLQDDLIIANATGCSSIYGGNLPNLPYEIPWASSLFEDNAEFGLGMHLAYKKIRMRIKDIMQKNMECVSQTTQNLFLKYFENMDDYAVTREVYENLKNAHVSRDLKDLLDYIPSRSVWCIGGDGWAYDIGFSGIDHLLASNENINILVLDSEVYSNTGGQMSKASHIGQVAEFAQMGKKTAKKDLFKIAMCYDNVYVASVALGANDNQCVKAFKEAILHKGPSLIIAYAPCVEHGIKGGMSCSLKRQKDLVECGYLLLMRYHDKTLTIDSKEPDFTKLDDVLKDEVRYNALAIKDKNVFDNLFKEHQKELMDRYLYYKNL